MKTRLFLKENWYKLTLSASAIIFSIGFFINSLQPAWAAPKESNIKSPKGQFYHTIVASGGYVYCVWYDSFHEKIDWSNKTKLP